MHHWLLLMLQIREKHTWIFCGDCTIWLRSSSVCPLACDSLYRSWLASSVSALAPCFSWRT